MLLHCCSPFAISLCVVWIWLCDLKAGVEESLLLGEGSARKAVPRLGLQVFEELHILCEARDGPPPRSCIGLSAVGVSTSLQDKSAEAMLLHVVAGLPGGRCGWGCDALDFEGKAPVGCPDRVLQIEGCILYVFGHKIHTIEEVKVRHSAHSAWR